MSLFLVLFLAVVYSDDHGHDHACQFWWPDYTTTPFEKISDHAGVEIPLVAGYCYTFGPASPDKYYMCDCETVTNNLGSVHSYTDTKCTEGKAALTSPGLCYCGDSDYEDCADDKEYYTISNTTCVENEESDSLYTFPVPYGCYWDEDGTILVEISDECESEQEDGHKIFSVSFNMWSADYSLNVTNCTKAEKWTPAQLGNANITSVTSQFGGEDCHDGNAKSILTVDCDDAYKSFSNIIMVVLFGFIATASVM